MGYSHLPQILDAERSEIRTIEKRWQPKDLLHVPQAYSILQDVTRRYEHLVLARDEMETLDRASLYVKYLTRMRFNARRAYFVWKADQLTFVRAIAAFYSDYGAVLRLLQEDSRRGLLPRDE